MANPANRRTRRDIRSSTRRSGETAVERRTHGRGETRSRASAGLRHPVLARPRTVAVGCGRNCRLVEQVCFFYGSLDSRSRWLIRQHAWREPLNG